MIGTTRKLAALIGAVMIVASIAGPAWAPKVFRRIAIRGAACTTSTGVSGSFSGSIQFTHVTAQDGHVLVAGVLEGICGAVELPRGESVLLSATLPQATADVFELAFASQSLELANMTVTFSLSMFIQPTEETTRLQAKAAQLYEDGQIDAAVGILNRLLSAESEATGRAGHK